MYSSFTINSYGTVTRRMWNGREYLVAPATILVEGVLNGSKGALFYPSREIVKNYKAWEGIPITLNHPTNTMGQPLSARDRGVIQRVGMGFIRHARIDTVENKLKTELWFDAKRTQEVDSRVYNALINNEPMELSTGLFTNNIEAKPGANYRGTPYDYIAKDYVPDHLAILPDQVGACSLNDGCGLLINQSMSWNVLTGNGGPGSGRHSESGIQSTGNAKVDKLMAQLHAHAKDLEISNPAIEHKDGVLSLRSKASGYEAGNKEKHIGYIGLPKEGIKKLKENLSKLVGNTWNVLTGNAQPRHHQLGLFQSKIHKVDKKTLQEQAQVGHSNTEGAWAQDDLSHDPFQDSQGLDDSHTASVSGTDDANQDKNGTYTYLGDGVANMVVRYNVLTGNGGPGSGNFGHAGIPGQVGGSESGGGGGGSSSSAKQGSSKFGRLAEKVGRTIGSAGKAVGKGAGIAGRALGKATGDAIKSAGAYKAKVTESVKKNALAAVLKVHAITTDPHIIHHVSELANHFLLDQMTESFQHHTGSPVGLPIIASVISKQLPKLLYASTSKGEHGTHNAALDDNKKLELLKHILEIYTKSLGITKKFTDEQLTDFMKKYGKIIGNAVKYQDPDDDEDEDDEDTYEMNDDGVEDDLDSEPLETTFNELSNMTLREVLLTYNERWPQEEREKLSNNDFAGPNQSFPIKSQKDVHSAAMLADHADDPDTVKKGIVKIAKKKGLSVPGSLKPAMNKSMRCNGCGRLSDNCSCGTTTTNKSWLRNALSYLFGTNNAVENPEDPDFSGTSVQPLPPKKSIDSDAQSDGEAESYKAGMDNTLSHTEMKEKLGDALRSQATQGAPTPYIHDVFPKDQESGHIIASHGAEGLHKQEYKMVKGKPSISKKKIPVERRTVYQPTTNTSMIVYREVPRKPKAKSSTTNQKRSGSMTRSQAVKILTANCKCSEDKAAIGFMSDAMVMSLARNAKADSSNADVADGTEGESIQAGSEGEDDDDENNGTVGAEEDEDVDSNVYPAPAPAKKGMSTNQWLESAPPEVRSVVQNALKVEQNQKRQIVISLINNAARKRQMTKQQRESVFNRYMQKTLPELRELQLMAGDTVTNQTAVIDDTTPLYLGASGATGSLALNSGIEDEKHILQIPTLNYDDVPEIKASAVKAS